MSFAGSSGGDMVVGLRLDDQLTPGLRTASAAAQAFSTSLTGSLSALSRLGAAGAPIAGVAIGLTAGVKAAADLQQQVANLNAVLATTPTQMAKITAASLEMSRQTQFNTAQIIQAQAQLAKAGTSPTDISGVGRSVLNLASATLSDPKAAATAYIAAQKDFQLTTGQSTDTVNILAQAVDSSTGTLANFQTAFRQIGPVAAANNLSLKDTTVAIADLTNAGLGTTSGTALKTFLQRIVTETPAARKEIQALGLDFFTAQGQLKPLPELFDQIRLKTAGLTDEQAQQALGTIFGTRGIRVADVAMEEGGAGLADVAQHMADIGDAGDIASKKLDTLQGQAHILGSSLNVLAVQGGNGVLPMLTDLTRLATGAANALSGLSGHTGGSSSSLALGAAAIFGEVKLSQGLSQRRATANAASLAATAPTAADDAAMQAYMDRESARYQKELANYEEYQKNLATFQAQELTRRQQNNQKIEDAEAAHQAKMVEIQQAGMERLAALSATDKLLPGPATAVNAETDARLAKQQAAFDAQMAGAAFPMGKAPTGVGAPAPIALPLDLEATAGTVALEESFLSQARSKATSLVSGAGAIIGKIAMPLLIGVTVKDMVIDPILMAETTRLANKDVPADADTFTNLLHTTGTTGPQTTDSYNADLAALDKRIADQQALAQKYKQARGFVGGVQGIDEKIFGKDSVEPIAAHDNALANIKQAQADRDKITAAKASGPELFTNDEISRAQDLYASISSGDKTLEDAQRAFGSYTEQLDQNTIATVNNDQKMRDMGLTERQIAAIDSDFTKGAIQASQDRKAALDAEFEAKQQQIDALSLARDQGASDATAQLAILGTDSAGNPADRAAIAAAKKDLTDLTKAWSDANSAVGKVDITKGLGNLADASDALSKAKNELTARGASNSSLFDLAGLAQQFSSIADAEKAAMADLNGYMLTLDETDKRMQQVGSLKTSFLDALNAAEDRQMRGTANQADLDLIANGGKGLNEFADATNKLQQNASTDWLGIINSDSLQNIVTADTTMRDMVDMAGGGKNLMLRVDADTTLAAKAIDTIVNGPHTTYLDIVTRVNGVPTTPGTDPIAPPSSSGGGMSGFAGMTPPFPGPGQAGQYAFGPNNPGGTNPATAGTNTPRGDATALLPYKDLIKQASDVYGVPEWLIGAVIMHESGGTPGAVQQGGMGRGLMQVDIGQNPQYANADLTGTSRDSIATQIKDGTIILRDMLKSRGPTAGIQGYAGPDYQSVAGGGAPAGLDLPTELTNYYKGAVVNALGIGTGAMGGDGGDGATSASGTTGKTLADIAASHLNEAKDATGKAWAGWCEQFVDDVKTAAGLPDNRPDNPEDALAQAKAGKPGAGRVLAPGETPQPGDQAIIIPENNPTLNGNPYNPSSIGHTGIVAQDTSKFYNTSTSGIVLSDIPTGTVFIRPDGVVTGPVPGSIATKLPHGATYAQSNQGQAAGATPQSYNPTGAPVLADLTAQMDRLARIVPTLSPEGFNDATGIFKTLQPILEKNFDATGGADGGPAVTIAEKQMATNRATSESATLYADVAQYLADAANHTGTIKDDLDKILADGGPIGANVAQQAQSYADIAKYTAAVKADQAASTSLTDAHNAALQQQTVDDQAAARKKTQDGWTDQLIQHSQQLMQQDTQNSWQDQSNALDDKKTKESRLYDDATTAEGRRHQLATRNLDDELKAAQKLQTLADSGNSVKEQALAQQAAGPGDLATKFGAGELLSIQKDFDARNKQTLTDQIQNIENEQTAETRKDEDAIYNLNQQHTIATRNFEDTATQATRNHEKMQKQWQADADQQWTIAFNTTKKDTEAGWALQDQRDKANQIFTTQKAIDDAQTKADQDNLTAATANQKAASDALTNWGDLYTLAGGTAQLVTPMMQSFTNAYQTMVAGLSASNGVPFNQFPAPGQFASGGRVSGWGIVGDKPNGDMSGAEAVFGNYTVYSHAQSVAMGLIAGSTPRYAAGSGGDFNLTVAPKITVTPRGTDEIEQVVEQILAPIRAQLRAALAGEVSSSGFGGARGG